MRLILTFAVSVFCFSFLGCTKEVASDKGKESYMVGYQMGSNLRSQGIDVGLGGYLAGFRDGIEGRQSQLNQADMSAAGQRLQAMAAAHMQNKFKDNLETGRKFLAENGKKPGWQTSPTGLQYQVVAEGKGPSPTENETVKVHYRGTLINGQQFDSSYERKEPIEFQVNRVIAGWTQALKMMKVGSKFNLAIPSELAYGANPPPGSNIAPHSVLLFEVELLGIKK